MNRTHILFAMIGMLSLLGSIPLFAQQYFNRYYPNNTHRNFINDIYSTGNDYMYISHPLDTTTLAYGYGIGHVDSIGDQLCYKQYIDTINFGRFFFSKIAALSDTSWFSVGTTLNGYLVVAYNQYCDTLFTRSFPFNYGEDIQQNIAEGIEKHPDGGYVVNIGESITNTHPDIGLIKLDSALNLEWTKMYDFGWESAFAARLFIDENGIITLPVITSTPWPYKEHLKIVRIRSNGNIHSVNTGPEEFYGVFRDWVQTPDGGYIGTLDSCWNDNTIQYNYFCRPALRKFSANWQQEWIQVMGHKIEFFGNLFRAVTIASDSTGVVAAGKIDEYREDSTGTRTITILGKVSWEGDSIWLRHIRHPDTPHTVIHILPYEMITTIDGGYLMCGVLAWRGVASQPQPGWLTKVDEYGCLVPGCHLVSAEEIETGIPEAKLLLSPNPVSTTVDVYTRLPHEITKAHLTIHDMQGKLVYMQDILYRDLTSAVWVEGWGEGLYIVRLVSDDGSVLAVEKMVVQGGNR